MDCQFATETSVGMLHDELKYMRCEMANLQELFTLRMSNGEDHELVEASPEVIVSIVTPMKILTTGLIRSSRSCTLKVGTIT